MSEPNNSNLDPKDEMTPLDRVRKQLDRILSRNEQPDPERQQQVDLRAEVERLLVEHDRRSRPTIDNNRQGDDSLSEQLNDRNIILRLREIQGLLERQEQIYQAKERARELRNRAISEYLVLGFVWLMGAFTMLIWFQKAAV
jgi:hypothetical protein